MKVLIIHNYYGSTAPSGENKVVDAEIGMLKQRGHQVELFSRHSDDLHNGGVTKLVKAAVSTPWSVESAIRIRKVVKEFRPDIIHAHNTFPLISPSVFHAVATGNGAATVITLHNYRLLCPAAIPMRSGVVCQECIETRSVWPALRHRCYRSSLFATAPLAANVALHRAIGTWQRKVDAFIALSSFQRDLVSQGGIPTERIHVRPNFVEGSAQPTRITDRSNQVLFVGRLSQEKGVHTLIEAWEKLGGAAPELLIIGDGPCKWDLVKQASGLPIRFLGQASKEFVSKAMESCKLLVLPSEWYETFGLVVAEAMARGTPAIVSDLGALPEIVDDGVNGLIFPAGDSLSLSKKVTAALDNVNLLQTMSANARATYDTKYSIEAGYLSLLKVYEQALASKQRLS